jgi:ankyrin repeat protein
MSENRPSALTLAVEAVRTANAEKLSRYLRQAPEIVQLDTPEADTLLGLACRLATGNVAIPAVAGTQSQHQVVDVILKAGADPDRGTPEGWSPLHTAAMSGHGGLAKRLLAAGAAIEGHLYQCQGGSPLALALFYAKTEVAVFLAQPAVPDNLRHAAALGKNLDRFFDNSQLAPKARQGLDFYRPLKVFPSWQRNFSRQEILDEALSWASRNDQPDSILHLIERGADINSNAYRGTPLLWSIYSDSVRSARLLLDLGADPDLKHDFGGKGHGVNATALHLAAQFGSLKCLRLLLNRGADPDIVDAAHGGTALGWAEFAGAKESVEVLRNWNR